MAIAARATLCNALNIMPPCPSEMLGSLVVVPLPNGDCQKLHDALLKEYQNQEPRRKRTGYGTAAFDQTYTPRGGESTLDEIELATIPWGQPMSRQVRMSAQIYNHPAQYAYLAKSLIELLSKV